MNREWELTGDEIDKVVNDAFNKDELLRHFVESRGHWEDISPIIARAAQAKLVRWLEKYCNDHPDSSWGIVRRADCPHCLDEIRKELEVENG